MATIISSIKTFGFCEYLLFIFYCIHALLVATGVNSHTEEEIQEANQRNRAVSSSAIQRAMTDANSGQHDVKTCFHSNTIDLKTLIHYLHYR